MQPPAHPAEEAAVSDTTTLTQEVQDIKAACDALRKVGASTTDVEKSLKAKQAELTAKSDKSQVLFDETKDRIETMK